MLPTSPLAAIRWLPLVNQSSSTIPAFACLRVVSTALDATGQLIYTIDQPNGDASANYLFNGPSAVAAGGGGTGTLDFPCQAIWDTSTPSSGDLWGPKSGQWTLAKGSSPGFPVLGVVDIGTHRMLIGAPSPAAAIIVKPDYDIAPISSATPGSGSGEVYTFGGTTLSDATRTVTVYNLSTQVAKGGTFYECIFVGGYAFIVNGGGSPTLFEATIYGMDLTSTATTASVYPTTAIWNSLPDSTTYPYPITARNDFGLQGPVSRVCLVAQSDAGTPFYLIQIQPPSDVLFEAELASTLLATDPTASVTVTGGTPIFGGLPAGTTITAKNDFGMAGSPLQKVLIAESISGTYYLLPTASQPLPILFWTTLSANLISGDATIGCAAGVTQIFGTMPASGITANNTLGLCGQNGTKVLVAGDANTPTPNYYLLAVAPSVAFWATLFAPLSSGSSTASVTPTTQVFGTTPTGVSFTANNLLGLSGSASDLVFVVQRESNGDYDLVAAKPSGGGGCVFTLQGDLSSGTAAATVTSPWGSAPDAIGATIVVNDLAFLFYRGLGPTSAAVAAEGIAIYDSVLGYTVVACDQETTMYAGTLGADLASTAATSNVGSLAPCDGGPFDQSTTAPYYASHNTLKLSGKSGDPCYIEWNASTTQWEIIAVQGETGGCTFSLTSAFSGGSATATVTTPWGSAPDAATASVTIYDPQGFFGRALSTAVGEAVYDSVNGYLVVACDQETTMYAGELGADMAASATTSNVGSLVPCDAKPFGQATTSAYLTSYNKLKLTGKSGDPCYIKWNQGNNEWEITEVKGGAAAGGCEFTLTSAFASGSASATVTAVWGTCPDTVGTAITVKDLAQQYGPAWTSSSAAKGVAVYDSVNSNYVAASCQTFYRYIFGVLTGSLVAGGNTGGNVVGGHDGVSPGSTVNLQSDDSTFTGVSGNVFRAYYDPATNKYYLIYVGC